MRIFRRAGMTDQPHYIPGLNVLPFFDLEATVFYIAIKRLPTAFVLNGKAVAAAFFLGA